MPKGRLEAFSDGVIAIVITLLVLEIHIPDVSHAGTTRELVGLLRPLVASLAMYLVSFMVCAVWWVAHHNLIHDLEQVDRKFLWANNHFLLWLALIPWPTALLGRNPTQPLLCTIYGLNCALTGGSFFFMRLYAMREGNLFKAAIGREVLAARVRRSALSPVLYLLATGAAWLDARIALAVFAAIPVYFAWLHVRR